MKRIRIVGRRALSGRIGVSGSKNAALAVLAATILAPGESIISNVPHIMDIYTMLEVLSSLGAEVYLSEAGEVRINTKNINSHIAPYDLVKRMRASFYVAGPLLARLGKAEVALPGGCVIGTRPVNFHLEGFQALGADVVVEHGFMKAKANSLQGARIDLPWSSVGATINLATAASLAEGTTTIEKAAREPEVVDFLNFLIRMGAKIEGIGTPILKIEGVKELRGCCYRVIPDRIEAGTYLIAGAITGGRVEVEGALGEHLGLLLMKLEEAGINIESSAGGIKVEATNGYDAIDEIVTAPYPGFPTDFQPPIVALLALARGTSIVRETIFDGRLGYVDELRRMGADIKIIDQTAIIRGVERLTGAPVEATDLRAGAALVLAGLAAEGETEVSRVEYIDRGYEKLAEKLRRLGAEIQYS